MSEQTMPQAELSAAALTVGDVRAMAQELDESWLVEAEAASKRILAALAHLPDDAVLAVLHERTVVT